MSSWSCWKNCKLNLKQLETKKRIYKGTNKSWSSATCLSYRLHNTMGVYGPDGKANSRTRRSYPCNIELRSQNITLSAHLARH